MENNKPTLATVIATINLGLSMLNQILMVFGKSPIPVDDQMIATAISTTWMIASSVWAWWRNNSFTKAAIEADKVLEQLRTLPEEE